MFSADYARMSEAYVVDYGSNSLNLNANATTPPKPPFRFNPLATDFVPGAEMHVLLSAVKTYQNLQNVMVIQEGERAGDNMDPGVIGWADTLLALRRHFQAQELRHISAPAGWDVGVSDSVA